MNTRKNPFRATGVAVITPFTSTGEPDIPALRRVISHLAEGGVEYLVALGTTGEAATLRRDEKFAVWDTFFEVAGETPVVLGCASNDTRALLEEQQILQQRYSRMAGFLSANPYYNKPSQEGIFQHYQAFCRNTDKPVILYNVPGRSSSNMLAATTLRIAHACPNAVAVKEASGNLEQVMEIIMDAPEGFEVISGDDALTVPMISMGAKGVISVAAHAAPRLFSDMVRNAMSGDFTNAREIHYRLLRITQLMFREGNPAGIKAVLHAMGLIGENLRLPLTPVSEGLRTALADELRMIG